MSALDDLMRSRGVAAPFAAASKPRKRQAAPAPDGASRSEQGKPIYYYDVIQGTQEWESLRAGVPTASAFDKIVTPGGGRSKSREAYMYKLCAERLLGYAIEGFKGRAMQRGNEKEPEALNSYMFQRDVEVKLCGFVTNEDGTIGASPDGLVDEDGIVEIKCPEEVSIHMGYLLKSGSPYDSYKVQCNGQLWVMQREWSDVLSYYPGLPKAVGRIERDEPFISLMAPLIEEFCVELGALYTQCIANGWAKEAPKPREKTISEVMAEVLIEAQKGN